VIFDVDDALYLPSPTEPQTEAARDRYRRNFDGTAGVADLVLCGNAEIAAQVPHDRTVILPTAIDVERFRPTAVEPGEGLTAGWVGHSSNLGFLEALADPLREIVHRHPGFRLIVVADRPPRMEELPIEFRRWSLDDEVTCFRGMDIGLMPLPDTPWTRAKCAFKLLQYMAFALPAIASPVGMNREVVEHGGNALFAASDQEWVTNLERLICERELRRRLGAAGRETVITRYSLGAVSAALVARLHEVLAGARPAPGLG
jgi:glycosyltransferase involved in cell wall biosynthesis